MKYYLVWWLLSSRQWAVHYGYMTAHSINDAYRFKADEEANALNKAYSYMVVEEKTELAKLPPPTSK